MEGKTALIFGSIPYEDWSFLQPLHELKPLVICADGGVHCARDAGFTPDWYIGDGDSGGCELPDGKNISLPAEKDLTDLDAACQTARMEGVKTIYLTACTGGRQDHHIANLQLLERLYEVGIRAFIIDPWNEIRVVGPETVSLPKGRYQYFSLLPIYRRLEHVSITGAKYPLSNSDVFRGQSRCVSNEFCGNVSITIGSGKAWVIQSTRG